MNRIDDFKIGEQVINNVTKQEATIVSIDNVSEVVYVRYLTNGEIGGIMNVEFIDRK